MRKKSNKITFNQYKTSDNIVIEDRSIGNSIRIYVNDIAHLCIKQSDLRALQAWKMGRRAKRFCAELHMFYENHLKESQAYTIELEYDSAELSKIVINILAEYV